MATLTELRAQWVTDNPSASMNPALTQTEYDARADDRALLLLTQQDRKLVGQAEIEALGFTVAQARTVYGQLKAGTASAANAQKALAGVMRYLWRDLINDL